MNYTEEAVHFSCAGNTMLGVVSRPELPVETGVIVIVGGPQYRVGSHRQFVLLSRALAAAGYPVMRFDYQGMGDSQGEQRDFESVSPDIASAIDALLKQAPTVKNAVLWGLCDGASAALLYCHEMHDPRVSGLCLLNPWVRSEASLAKTQVKHYYTQRIRQKEFWIKLFSGGVAPSAIAGFIKKIQLSRSASAKNAQPDQPFQERMATGWHGFAGRILLLLSAEDYTAKEFTEHANADPAWRNSMGRFHLQRHEIQGVDHTFSSAISRELVEKFTLDWLSKRSSPTSLDS